MNPLYDVIARTLRAAEDNPSDDEYALLTDAVVEFVAEWIARQEKWDAYNEQRLETTWRAETEQSSDVTPPDG